MTHRIIVSLAALALILSASVASAQGVDVKARVKTEVRYGTSTESRAEMKAEAEARRASSTERRVEMQQSISRRKAEQAARAFSATVERLEKILARIDSRIAKVKSEGGDVAESERYAAEARMHLGEAKKSAEAFATLDLSATIAQKNFDSIRAAAAEVKKHLRAAHQSMMMTVRNLKPGQSNRGNATSTSSLEVSSGQATSTSQ